MNVYEFTAERPSSNNANAGCCVRGSGALELTFEAHFDFVIWWRSEKMPNEHARLQEARDGTAHWRKWGPYLSERQHTTEEIWHPTYLKGSA